MTIGYMMFPMRTRLAALLCIVCSPLLLGSFSCGGAERPRDIPYCGAPVSWTPERIQLLDMSDRHDVSTDGIIHELRGSQGSAMIGVYVVVYGDDIPECLAPTISLNESAQMGQWVFESDGDRRARPEHPVYWTWGWGESDVISVTIGDLTQDFEVIVVR